MYILRIFTILHFISYHIFMDKSIDINDLENCLQMGWVPRTCINYSFVLTVKVTKNNHPKLFNINIENISKIEYNKMIVFYKDGVFREAFFSSF